MPEIKKRLIQRKKLSDVVFEQLLSLIEEDNLQPGDQMPAERELMETFGVGRPVVREAMQRLAGMGMITIQHGERAKVGQVDMHSMIGQIDLAARHLLSSSASNVDHLRQARTFFETGLVKIAAQKASPADISRLEAIVANMHKLKDSPDFITIDMEFHGEIARISGNPIYSAISRAILEWMADYRQEMLRAKARELTIAEHEEILKFIKQGDASGAEQAMHDHLVTHVGE
ncbi:MULTISPECIES: transcriptional regulator NanR [Pseudomonas]|jgi:DNA-binding FadR family transcriptional regulator|uniref:GntR family transcriptional regulator n=1 Tax=Pseudomonas syringae TaxID=317 RepID=A0A085V669_PSESX|nr:MULTISPECIES: transcriptional regulator NanR [Pseudomonas]EPJ84740.1 transcriptional regulator NanR [Pseudomonas sp. CFII64]KFE50932.1 GntR family transcriptional regulator [Pseudomonas syringae]